MRWGPILAWTPSMWCMCGPRGEINTRHFLYLAVNFRFENGLKRQKATRFNFRFTPKWNCPKILQMFPRPQKHKSKVQRRGNVSHLKSWELVHLDFTDCSTFSAENPDSSWQTSKNFWHWMLHPKLFQKRYVGPLGVLYLLYWAISILAQHWIETTKRAFPKVSKRHLSCQSQKNIFPAKKISESR